MSEEMKSVRVAPIVRVAAKEDGIDLNQITGTGRNGAITKSDYEHFTGKEITATFKQPEERAPMNHLTDDTRSLTIGGKSFSRSRVGLDHSSRKTVDIPENVKNNELHYRVVIDDRGKLEYAKSLGYQIVDDLKDPNTGEKIEHEYRVGSKKDGSSQLGYLMAIPKKWKQERDQAAEKERRSLERGLFTNPVDDQNKELGKDFYNKGSKIE